MLPHKIIGFYRKHDIAAGPLFRYLIIAAEARPAGSWKPSIHRFGRRRNEPMEDEPRDLQDIGPVGSSTQALSEAVEYLKGVHREFEFRDEA